MCFRYRRTYPAWLRSVGCEAHSLQLWLFLVAGSGQSCDWSPSAGFVSLMGAAPELSRRTVNVSKSGANGCVTFAYRRWFHDCVSPSFAPDDYYWRLRRHNGTEPSVLLLSGSIRASGPDTIHPQAPASGEFTDEGHHLVNTGLLFKTSAVWDSAPRAAKKLLNLFIYLCNNCR